MAILPISAVGSRQRMKTAESSSGFAIYEYCVCERDQLSTIGQSQIVDEGSVVTREMNCALLS